MNYSAVFIDFDDTLIDTMQDTEDTVRAIYNVHSLARHFDSFDDYYNNYFRPNILEIWRRYEQGLITRDELLYQRFLNTLKHLPELGMDYMQLINEDYLDCIVKATTLLPGAKDLLDYLKGKYPLYMISNGFINMQYAKMDTVGIAGYFDGVILSDDVGASKPSPLIFEAALKVAGESVENVIMIGDNYVTDITGAREMGIDQIWYNPTRRIGYHFSPTYSVRTLEEIKNIL